MDSNDARDEREDERHLPSENERLASDAEERTPPKADAPQAAGGEAAAPGCHSNTRGETSLLEMEGYPDYRIAGGVDWFEWWSLTHWRFEKTFAHACELIRAAKQTCQHERAPYTEIHLPDFGPVRVHRLGFNRGGDRGQHFEFRLLIPGVTIGISPRDIDPELKGRELGKKLPNFVAKQTGRDCLLFGPADGYEMADALITALGGESIAQRISRGDLCLDIVGLPVEKLLVLVEKHHFITRASGVRPNFDYVTDITTGFNAGRHPLYMTVYDKVRERFGKVDALYNRALIDRRWGGVIPEHSTRIEMQIARRRLREFGIDSPQDFLQKRGTLADYLTGEWFRLTDTPVDRRGNHQSRAEVHPLWRAIQQSFAAIFGPPEGTLAPLEREKVEPIELASQGRGCLAACLLQMGIDFRTYAEFVHYASDLLTSMFPKEDDRQAFLIKNEKRRMEFEVS